MIVVPFGLSMVQIAGSRWALSAAKAEVALSAAAAPASSISPAASPARARQILIMPLSYSHLR